MTNPYGKLVSELRYKNYTATAISQIVADAKAHVQLSGTDPSAEFGQGEEYPKQSTPSGFKVAVTIGYIAVLAAFVLTMLLRLLSTDMSAWPRFYVIGFATVAALLLVGLIGYIYSFRVPKVRA